MNSTTIVGYIYRADIYCTRCITTNLYADPNYDGWRVADGADPISTEDDLNETAAAFGIDRHDETTFDSNAFPKVVFCGDDADGVQCADCMQLLTDDEQDEDEDERDEQHTPNLGAPAGDVGTGDLVICGSMYALVTRVTTKGPGHSVQPIRSDMSVVIVETTNGTRYLGADRVWIGSDLRMHWSR